MGAEVAKDVCSLTMDAAKLMTRTMIQRQKQISGHTFRDYEGSNSCNSLDMMKLPTV